MKKIVLLAMLIVVYSLSFAQKIQFTDKTNVWYMRDSTVGCCIPHPVSYTLAYYDSTPASYNGHTYLLYNCSIASALVREDAGKVYIINNTDSIERVLYDYTLGVGDTLRTIYTEDKLVAWVTQIDSTELAGNWYKVWHFQGVDTNIYIPDSVRPTSYNVIEGIGCTNGGVYAAYPYSRSSFFQQLLCFKNGMGVTGELSLPVISYGDTSYDYYDNNVSCGEFHAPDTIVYKSMGVNTISKNAGNAIVVPNPIAGAGKIILPYATSGSLVIYNALGQVITSRHFTDQSDITIDNMPAAGMYFFRAMDNAGAVFNGKFSAR